MIILLFLLIDELPLKLKLAKHNRMFGTRILPEHYVLQPDQLVLPSGLRLTFMPGLVNRDCASLAK